VQGRHWPHGRRIGVVTGSGGQAELILDVANTAGIELPPLQPDDRAEVERVVGTITGDGNPLDAWGAGDFRTNFPHALNVLGASGRYDAIALCGDGSDAQPLANPGNNPVYIDILNAAASRADRPFYYLTTHAGVFRQDQVRLLREGPATMLSGSRQGLLAIDKLARWNELRRPRRGVAVVVDALTRAAGRPTINEHDAKAMLAAAGVQVTAERLVATPEEAETAAAAIGYPVVLKVISDDIPHKTEFGLVEIALPDAASLRAAWDRLSARLLGAHLQGPRLQGAHLQGPGLQDVRSAPRIAGFLVQQMVPGGVEAFVGVKRDTDFGLVLALGLGGVLIEVIGEAALRPLPLADGDVEAMLAELPIASKLLAGVRGAPAADVAALTRAVYAVADFAYAARDHIEELDVNPIKVLPDGQGCLALDALIIPCAPAAAASVETHKP
jgi:acyl-CoA synthetase (NDP forming)